MVELPRIELGYPSDPHRTSPGNHLTAPKAHKRALAHTEPNHSPGKYQTKRRERCTATKEVPRRKFLPYGVSKLAPSDNPEGKERKCACSLARYTSRRYICTSRLPAHMQTIITEIRNIARNFRGVNVWLVCRDAGIAPGGTPRGPGSAPDRQLASNPS